MTERDRQASVDRTSLKAILLGGLAQGAIIIAASILFNVVLFGAYNESISVGRPQDSWHMRGLLPASTFAFGIGVAFVFDRLGRALSGSPTRRGAKFGLLLWGGLVAWLELFNFALYEFPFMATVAGLLCYLVALVAGGVVLGHIVPHRSANPA